MRGEEPPHPRASWGGGNYLRMRGEEGEIASAYAQTLELPPHARRRGGGGTSYRGAVGITSACAEKRSTFSEWLALGGNYLRMRGEE